MAAVFGVENWQAKLHWQQVMQCMQEGVGTQHSSSQHFADGFCKHSWLLLNPILLTTRLT